MERMRRGNGENEEEKWGGGETSGRNEIKE